MTDDLIPSPPDVAATEAARYPLLTDVGRRLLHRLEQHPHAPRYNYYCGDRLTREQFFNVQAFEAELMQGDALLGWDATHEPHWVAEFVARAYQDVPLYRRRGGAPPRLAMAPTLSRADVLDAHWALVPDLQPLDGMLVFPTSATTGRPVPVLSEAATPAKYLPILRWALGRFGLHLEGGAGRVAIVQVCYQRYTYTLCSICTYLDQAAQVKVNLAPGEWRNADDRARFLDDLQPELFVGDPIGFAALLRLPITWRPKALVSSAQTLLPGLRAELERHFACPVIDFYSITESGPIAMGSSEGFLIFPRRLYVEIVDADGRRLSPGERGEITLTGGFNPFLPLIRYRTGDFGCIAFRGGQPLLTHLEMRHPIIFRGTNGQTINNIDVTMALEPFALSRYALHQFADGRLRLRLEALGSHLPIQKAILDLFGLDQLLDITSFDGEASEGKIVQYTSDMPVNWRSMELSRS
jgi:phenylacetate-CoA ligase